MSGEYEIIAADPIKKLESEVEELKQYIHNIKEELAINTTSSISTSKKADSRDPIGLLLEYGKINQEVVNSLIKSNIELQSKIAELIVSTHELNKNVQRLVDIFKEAAIEYLEKMKKGEINKGGESNIEANLFTQKLEDIEKINLKIVEALEKLNKSIDSLKRKDTEAQRNQPYTNPKQSPYQPPKPPAPPFPGYKFYKQ